MENITYFWKNKTIFEKKKKKKKKATRNPRVCACRHTYA